MTTITHETETDQVSLQVRVPSDIARKVRVKAAGTVGIKPRDIVVDALREYFARQDKAAAQNRGSRRDAA